MLNREMKGLYEIASTTNFRGSDALLMLVILLKIDGRMVCPPTRNRQVVLETASFKKIELTVSYAVWLRRRKDTPFVEVGQIPGLF